MRSGLSHSVTGMPASTPLEIRMPQVASDMTEADVVSWLFQPGEPIELGDVLLEIETEKSTVEIEAPAKGSLLEILVPAGTVHVAVGTLLARMESQEDAPPENATPEKKPEPAENTQAPIPAPATPSSPPKPTQTKEQPEHRPPPATALAQRLAQRSGLDLTQVDGSGAHGRITRRDIDGHKHEHRSSPTRPDSLAEFERNSPTAHPGPAPLTTIELTVHCRVDVLLETLERLNANSPEGHSIEVRHAVLQALIRAAQEVPEAFRLPSNSEEAAQTITVAEGSPSAGQLMIRHQVGTGSPGIGRLVEIVESNRAAQESATTADLLFVDPATDHLDVVRVGPPVPTFPRMIGVGSPVEVPLAREGELSSGHSLTLSVAVETHAASAQDSARFTAALRRFLEDPLRMLL